MVLALMMTHAVQADGSGSECLTTVSPSLHLSVTSNGCLYIGGGGIGPDQAPR